MLTNNGHGSHYNDWEEDVVFGVQVIEDVKTGTRDAT